MTEPSGLTDRFDSQWKTALKYYTEGKDENGHFVRQPTNRGVHFTLTFDDAMDAFQQGDWKFARSEFIGLLVEEDLPFQMRAQTLILLSYMDDIYKRARLLEAREWLDESQNIFLTDTTPLQLLVNTLLDKLDKKEGFVDSEDSDDEPEKEETPPSQALPESQMSLESQPTESQNVAGGVQGLDIFSDPVQRSSQTEATGDSQPQESEGSEPEAVIPRRSRSGQDSSSR